MKNNFFKKITLILNFMIFFSNDLHAKSDQNIQTAVIAGGCFWGIEELLEILMEYWKLRLDMQEEQPKIPHTSRFQPA